MYFFFRADISSLELAKSMPRRNLFPQTLIVVSEQQAAGQMFALERRVLHLCRLVNAPMAVLKFPRALVIFVHAHVYLGGAHKSTPTSVAFILKASVGGGCV